VKISRFTIDLIAMAAMLAIALSYGRWLNFHRYPVEDAAMIMRYADHLAHGYGTVWNIGEAPVDGATDFLFMVCVAGLMKTGLSAESAIRGLDLGAHLLTVLLVYWANRRLWNAPVVVALLCGWYFAASNGLAYVAAYFGTPFFTLLATITWMIALKIIRDKRSTIATSVAFAASGLVTGLIRPEGVILASLMLVAIVVAVGWQAAARTVSSFAIVFLTVGGAYFLWRWSYFGYPLPNPYYKKGAGELHWASLRTSLMVLIGFGRPFLPLFLLGLRSPARTRLATAVLLPPLAFSAAFVLISNEMNFGGRFQYTTLPLILIAWVPIVDDLVDRMQRLWRHAMTRREQLAWTLVAGALAFMAIRYSAAQRCEFQAASEVCGGAGTDVTGLYDAANVLGQYRDRGYVLATTEAGLLPFYSGWKAIDTWGLNDQWIAHHGGQVTAEYLDRSRPHVIVSHAYFSPTAAVEQNPRFMEDPWNRMTVTIRDYAISHGYILAAAFGVDPQNLHYYYVRPDFPESQAVSKQLASLRYRWYGTFQPATNFASP
jgi:hypothetical protein